MTGPSSIQGAQVIRLKKANCTVTAHSQVRDLKSAQPSAISARRVERAAGSVPDAPAGSRPPGSPPPGSPPPGSPPPGSPPPGSRAPGSRAGRRSRLSASTLTAYDAASAATTTAGPATAIRAPPSAGPAIVVAEPASPYSVFALPS